MKVKSESTITNPSNKNTEGVILIPLKGKLVGGTETRKISNQINTYINQGHNKIILDFEQVKWINSLGIGALIKWLHILRNNGGDLRFANTSHKVYQYLKITKLLTVIQTYENPNEAVSSFTTHASC